MFGYAPIVSFFNEKIEEKKKAIERMNLPEFEKNRLKEASETKYTLILFAIYSPFILGAIGILCLLAYALIVAGARFVLAAISYLP